MVGCVALVPVCRSHITPASETVEGAWQRAVLSRRGGFAPWTPNHYSVMGWTAFSDLAPGLSWCMLPATACEAPPPSKSEGPGNPVDL